MDVRTGTAGATAFAGAAAVLTYLLKERETERDRAKKNNTNEMVSDDKLRSVRITNMEEYE